MGDPVNTFLKLAGALNYPVFIVTAAAGEEREGCVIGFASQTSFQPARFLACLSRANRTYRFARDTGELAVHLVPREQKELVDLFGGKTGDEVDKFACCEWRPGPRGLPILAGCPSWFAGEILDRIDLGDHVGHLLAPFAIEFEPGEIMYFQDVTDIDPGHPA